MGSDMADDICWRIVTTIADERDVDPRAIDDRLQDVVDVESLSRLVDQAWGSDDIDLSVSFRMAGCFVTITGDETVRATVPE
ncbi:MULTISPECIES: HalOD1 output domain-containing protein [Haloferacaceae]|uniref:HalOD1 output domain-containing protein n=1 Tax=Halorubrum glutamatedens TaxID=2707018 RepID=A0ABD5QSL7_9EURY|nr:HalOD1 output domain-containing protein [Halobellus captivus]